MTEKKTKPISLAKQYELLGISKQMVNAYMRYHPELTKEEAIQECGKIKEKENELKRRCKEHEIDHGQAVVYMRKNMHLSVDDIVKIYINKNNKKETFTFKCKKAGIVYKRATTYKTHHPELTEDEVIQALLDKDRKKIEKIKSELES